MNTEFEEYPTINNRLPDIASVLAQRIASKQINTSDTNLPAGTLDPYQLLLNKKISETGEINKDTIQKWPDETVKKLHAYCEKMGIVGFSPGKMHPSAALALLKGKYGDDYTDIPLNERLPAGYEKMGTPSNYNSNYPYSEAIQKKQILHG